MKFSEAEVVEATSGNTSFSAQVPGLQLAVDSTSLGEFKLCPRRYALGVLLGYQPRGENVHLRFGILLHEGRHRYELARSANSSHEDALAGVVRWVLEATWDRELGRGWVSDHPQKTRLSLVRTLVWYLDSFGASDSFETIQLASGTPAIELSFRFELATSPSGEPWVLCGHLDRIARLGGGTYILDLKSTGQPLGERYWSQFTPHNQFTLYTIAGEVVWGEHIDGLVVDAAQVGAGFTRFQRKPVPRPRGVRDEWMSELAWWLGQMHQCASALVWPGNDKSCDAWGGCPFRGVCGLAPGARRPWLAANFARRQWDPLVARGDV